MKPVILVTTNIDTADSRYNRISRDYCRSVISSGGVPLIADNALINDIEQLLDLSDGLLLSGGGDIHSKYFNEPLHEKVDCVIEERDCFEIALFLKAFERNMPVLGICRGSQVINVALGGNIVQHIDGHLHFEKRFEQVHSIKLEEDSLLWDIIGEQRLLVNSIHHQCIGNAALGIRISAYSDDGVIEAIECKDKQFVLGVQWHPEILYEKCEMHRKLFDRFVAECRNTLLNCQH